MPQLGKPNIRIRRKEPSNDDSIKSLSGFSLSSQSDSEWKYDRQTKSVGKRQVTFEQQTNVQNDDKRGLRSCLVTKMDKRFSGGGEKIPYDCKKPPPGIHYLTGVTTSEVQMTYTVPQRRINKCGYFPRAVDTRTVKDRGTQTLYRESSAQTLPYLPEVEDRERVETLELFNITTILPGDKKPGLYEVEILERARKRWAFTAALKTNFKQQFKEAREKVFASKYRSVLEAFEWEKWIEREEYIQECQMMRLDIVVRMFDKREREMHNASKTRIEIACEKIEQRRQEALKKNEVEFQRAMRRLKRQQEGPMRWRKEKVTYALGSPCSDFAAPLLRHGVNPQLRHFVGGCKAFDMRIDDLDKRVNLNNLECPFAKLKRWSKPKEKVQEYEQNFCTDHNLQKLYETLKNLRTQASKRKMTPKCLVQRQTQHTLTKASSTSSIIHEERLSSTDEPDEQEDEVLVRKVEPVLEEKDYPKNRAIELLQERRQEELENMLYTYEGTTIGWVMQFLSEEMDRLKEQRKLHFFAILAQKERWRREAAEAGLRQKENEMRGIYEELFQMCDIVNTEVCKEYLDGILTTDMSHNAEWDAKLAITDLAQQIDRDIQRWLDSFKLIQTPLTFDSLRYMLRDFIFPNVNDILRRNEKNLIVKYIIDDVLFPHIEKILEPWDVVNSITDEFLDRLVDNDLYYFSTDTESERGDQTEAEHEIEAILRKLVRYGTPGRRWLTPEEREQHNFISDLLDDLFTAVHEIQEQQSESSSVTPADVHEMSSRVQIHRESNHERRQRHSLPMGESELLKIQTLSLLKRMKEDKITRPLYARNVLYKGEDGFKDTDSDKLIKMEEYLELFEIKKRDIGMDPPPPVIDIPSSFAIDEIEDFREFKELRKLSKLYDEDLQQSSSQMTDIGIKFEPDKARRRLMDPEIDSETQTCVDDMLMSVLKQIIPSEQSDFFDDVISKALEGNEIKDVAAPTITTSVSQEENIEQKGDEKDEIKAPSEDIEEDKKIEIDEEHTENIEASEIVKSAEDDVATKPAVDDAATEPAVDDAATEPAMDDAATEPAVDDVATEPAEDVANVVADATEGDNGKGNDGEEHDEGGEPPAITILVPDDKEDATAQKANLPGVISRVMTSQFDPSSEDGKAPIVYIPSEDEKVSVKIDTAPDSAQVTHVAEEETNIPTTKEDEQENELPNEEEAEKRSSYHPNAELDHERSTLADAD